ncbi:MAG: DsbA family protein [Rhodocyclaceae bacterium]
MSATLHYIFDPMCGWCYGAAPLVRAAREIDGLTVVPHGGGMFSGANIQHVNEGLRNYVMQHDQRIAKMSGQPFGQAYFDVLLRDHDAVFDSDPPIAAILAAEAMGGRGLDMLARIQTAHYVDGRRVADRSVLLALAAEIGLDAAAFATRFDAVGPQTIAEHTRASNALLRQVGGGGYPTFALEHAGQIAQIPAGPYLGKPAAWQALLISRLD